MVAIRIMRRLVTGEQQEVTLEATVVHNNLDEDDVRSLLLALEVEANAKGRLRVHISELLSQLKP